MVTLSKRLLFNLSLFLSVAIASCSDDNSSNEPFDFPLEMNVGETHTLNVNNVKLQERNDFVFYMENGNVIKANHTGHHRTLVTSDEETFYLDVTVSQNETLYVDLRDFIGMERSEIEKMFGNAVEENLQGTCTYEGTDLEDKIQVNYEYGKAKILSITFDEMWTDRLREHLSDRYALLVERNNEALYADWTDLDNAETIVYLQWNMRKIMATYMSIETYNDI